MSKRKRNSLNPHHNPRQRKDFIDYDYTSKLNAEETEFLEKFTNEFYGGAFKINPTFIKENDVFIQVSGNSDRSKNRDLRKLRGTTLYYHDENGDFTSNPDYKYSPDTLHKDPEDRKELYLDNNRRIFDVSSAWYPSDNANNTLHTEILNKGEVLSVEDFGLVEEAIRAALEVMDYEYDRSEDLQDVVNKMGRKKSIELVGIIKDLI